MLAYLRLFHENLLIFIDIMFMLSESVRAATFRGALGGRRRSSLVHRLSPRTPEAYLTHFSEEQATANLVDLDDVPQFKP